MKRKYRLWVGIFLMGILINGVGILGGNGGGALTGDLSEDPVLEPGVFCSTPPPEYSPEEWCKFVRTVQNLDYIGFEVDTMAFFSFQYPQTYAQLGQSMYACVRPQDLTNPYTGQPVQEESDPSPGNLRWTYNPQTRDLTVDIAYTLGGENHFYTRFFPGSDLVIYEQQEQEYPEPKYPDDASENEKHSWMCGWILQSHYLSHYSAMLQTPHYDVPPTYAEMLRRFPVLKKMWNPFQNRFIQEVPMEEGWASPHPGDVSYSYIAQNEFEFYVWGELDENGDVNPLYP